MQRNLQEELPLQSLTASCTPASCSLTPPGKGLLVIAFSLDSLHSVSTVTLG